MEPIVIRVLLFAAVPLLEAAHPFLVGRAFAWKASEATSPAVLQVVIHDGAGVPAELLSSASHEASKILQPAGVAVQWLNCSGHSVSASSFCAGPSTTSRLFLRILARRARTFQRSSIGAGDSVDVLGDAFCVRGKGGRYGTIYYGSIERVAGRSQVEMGRLLGFVMAHEIGHLLLGPQHSAGVMAAHCRATEVLKDPERFVFMAADRSKLNAEARSRMRVEAFSGHSIPIP